MALDDSALINLAELRRYIGAKAGDTSKDDLLTDCINEASGMIIDFCNRDFKSQDYVVYAHGRGNYILVLPQFPVTTVSEIKVVASDGSEENLLTGDDTIENTVDMEGSTITLRKGYFFPSGQRNIKVSYTAGYETIPYAITKACKEIATMIYKESKGGEDLLGVRSESKGVGAASSKSYNTSSNDLLEKIAPFRRINVWSGR